MSDLAAAELAAAARIVRALANALVGRFTADALHELADDTEHQPDGHNHAVAAALLDVARRELAPEIEQLREQLEHSHAYVAELLAEEHRPRVWLPGDTVPEGAWAEDLDGEVFQYREHVLREGDALVEVDVPGTREHAAAVAGERARREAGEVR